MLLPSRSQGWCKRRNKNRGLLGEARATSVQILDTGFQGRLSCLFQEEGDRVLTEKKGGKYKFWRAITVGLEAFLKQNLMDKHHLWSNKKADRSFPPLLLVGVFLLSHQVAANNKWSGAASLGPEYSPKTTAVGTLDVKQSTFYGPLPFAWWRHSTHAHKYFMPFSGVLEAQACLPH